MKPIARTFALLLPFVWTGCLDRHAGGTSTETENAVVARSFLVDSVLPHADLPVDEPVVATLRLDSSLFDFSASRPDGKDLEIARMDGKAIPFEIVFWDPAASRGRLRARIDTSLRGHDARLQVRSGLSPATRFSSTAVWAGIPSARRLAWNSALVDDFESGNLLNSRLPVSSFWFLGGSLTASGSAPANSGRTGTSLHLVCSPGQCGSDRALLTATMLANSPRSFRALDSIEFWTRGSGSVWIAFESLDSVQMGRMQRGRLDSLQPRRCWTSKTLDTTWRRWSIKPSEFDDADGLSGNVGWPALRDSINYLTVLLQNGSELWIDDIRLHGIELDDLR
ncbi:MAG TPA: hypothetical protein PK208_10405 [Fibrobacteria bacterium]|nr:hypothetical protein [Fibrobacteria bacterium]